MKNKKLLTRLFALLASLVLVLALALPCFAEETEQPPTDYIYKRVYGFDEILSLFASDKSTVPCIIKETYEVDEFFGGSLIFDKLDETAYVYWQRFQSDGIFQYILDIYYDSIDFTINFIPFSGDLVADSVTLSWDEIELYILVPVSSTPTDSTTPSSDMYSNLFNILKDAVYGSDAELTGSQEYALTLISTILTYATILLPVILVIFIAVWCFKRF